MVIKTVGDKQYSISLFPDESKGTLISVHDINTGKIYGTNCRDLDVVFSSRWAEYYHKFKDLCPYNDDYIVADEHVIEMIYSIISVTDTMMKIGVNMDVVWEYDSAGSDGDWYTIKKEIDLHVGKMAFMSF